MVKGSYSPKSSGIYSIPKFSVTKCIDNSFDGRESRDIDVLSEFH